MRRRIWFEAPTCFVELKVAKRQSGQEPRNCAIRVGAGPRKWKSAGVGEIRTPRVGGSWNCTGVSKVSEWWNG